MSLNQILWICILLVIHHVKPTSAFAQPNPFSGNDRQITHYGVEDGLSQGSVYSMLRDSRDFLWFTSYEGLNRFDGHNFKVYYPQKGDSTALSGNVTLGLIEDPYGNIWIGSETCLNRYLRKTDNFDYVFAIDPQGQSLPSVHYPFYADSSEVWYMNEEEGIIAYNYHTQKKRLLSHHLRYQWSSSIINSVRKGYDDLIWIRQEEGITSFDPVTKTIKAYFTKDSTNILGPPSSFICHLPNTDGSLWLGTTGGITHFTPAKKEWQYYEIDPLADFADIAQSKDGYLYLGTEDRGLYLFHPEQGVIKHMTPENSSLSNTSTANIYLDKEELLWINVDPEGIDVLYPKRNGFKRFGSRYLTANGISSKGIRCFAESPTGELWVGSQDDGLFIMEQESNEILQHLQPNTPGGFPENHAAFIRFDQEKRTWIGTYNGLFLSQENGFTLIDNGIPISVNNPAHEYWNMAETSEGYLFTSTSRGLYFAPPQSNRFYLLDTLTQISAGNIQIIGPYLLIPEFHRGFWVFNYKNWIASGQKSYELHHFLADFNVKHFATTSDSILWIATTSGLVKSQLSTAGKQLDIIKQFDKKDGLPSAYIYGILKNDPDELWLSTNRGICQFDTRSELSKTFGPEENVQGYEFNTNAHLKSRAGDFYFGGTQGFNRFRPPLDSIPTVSEIQITNLYVNGKPFESNSYVGELSSIQLPYKQNTLTLKFAAIDYWSQGKNQYKVKLQGYDREWIALEQGEIRYTGIPSGQYTFRILAANANGIWKEHAKEMELQILAPWYFTHTAITIYLLTLIGIAWQWRQFRQRRARLNQQLLEEQSEAKRLKELEEFKNRFYTNVTHEFRTPLTIILGLVDELERKPSSQYNYRLNIIRQSGQNLLGLVNQVLELARIEAGVMKRELVQDDIISFLKVSVESFHSLAAAKQIELMFLAPTRVFAMDYDPDHLQLIVSNLLSNAIKFTPSKGQVEVAIEIHEDVKGEALELTVSDTGPGIQDQHLPFVFDRFYQADDSKDLKKDGIGIGLALTKELVSLAGGEVTVESELDKGSTFRVKLPVTREASSDTVSHTLRTIPRKERTVSMPSPPASSPLNAESPHLLLVDDNQHLVNYLHRILANRYHITTASNGKEAIQLAEQLGPQLIVSDVMMPEMDGYELCQVIKDNPSTTHIPVILLTARTEKQDRMAGLTHGADAYLTKPFDQGELIIQIEQLLEQREKLKSKYWNAGRIRRLEDLNIAPKNHSFLQEVDACILQHLQDPKFKVDQLAKALHMSRSSLFSRMKESIGKSPSEYLSIARLDLADELIRNTNMTIEAIADRTGFSSPSYFAKKYEASFGLKPSNRRNKEHI